ncbi:MAG TPA: hypothetical protein PLO27_10875 [Marmoricola sp.]|nr:hypothetical protein [Marmoricola sp.]
MQRRQLIDQYIPTLNDRANGWLQMEFTRRSEHRISQFLGIETAHTMLAEQGKAVLNRLRRWQIAAP